MKILLNTAFSLTLLCCFFFAPSQANADLVNGGFENGGAGWGAFGAAGFNDFFGGDGHASLFADNAGNGGGVFQQGIAGTAGDEYTFSLTNVLFEANAAGNFEFGLEFFDATDSTQVGRQVTSFTDSSPVSLTAVAPVGTVFVRPIIVFDSAVGADTQANVFVFDSTLTVVTAVPEPSSMALIVLAICPIALRRRKA